MAGEDQAYASEVILKQMIRALPNPGPLDAYSKTQMEDLLAVLKKAAYKRGFDDGAAAWDANEKLAKAIIESGILGTK